MHILKKNMFKLSNKYGKQACHIFLAKMSASNGPFKKYVTPVGRRGGGGQDSQKKALRIF